MRVLQKVVPRKEPESFTRVDAAAYYQLSENLRLQLNIENLLDEEYYPHSYSHQFTVGAPISATVSIKGNFLEVITSYM